MRSWSIAVTKQGLEENESTTQRSLIRAKTAQQAMRALVDLTTNNAQVIHVEVTEVTEVMP